MFFELLLFILLGVFLGIIIGIAPGIHPNMVIIFVPLLLSLNLHPYYLLALIVTIAVVNTIVDIIPSILLGAPDEGTELGILPGHELLMGGYGYQAIKFAVIGSFFSVIFCIIFIPVFIIFVPFAYNLIKPIIYLLLIAVLFIMVCTEKKKIAAILIVLLAGLLGIVSFQLPIDNSIILFPILTGLFGMSTLLIQIRKNSIVPKQHDKEYDYPKKSLIKSSLLGAIAGFISGLLPAVGTSQMAYFASLKKSKESFLVMIGAISTANIIISFLCLWLIGRARSGVAVAVDNFLVVNFDEFLLIAIISLIACALAVLITLKIAKKFISFIEKINYTTLSISVIIILNVLVLVFSGLLGLFIAWLCTFLGIYTILAGVKRSQMLAILIIPTILIFMGI